MEKIEHRFVEAGGLNLHVAEIGTGSTVVVFLHGFPEIWYTWRYQMLAVAEAGFRAMAPDYRGYGLSDRPPHPDKTTFADLVGDLLAIFDSLSIQRGFLVAKDFGGRPAFQFALLHPERVSGVISLGVPFNLGLLSFRNLLPEGFYISRWQEPGRAEADFARFDPSMVVRKIYVLFSKSEIPIAPEDKEVMDLMDPMTDTLPPWISEDDIAVYGSLYTKSGFETALQVPYRSIREEIGVKDAKMKPPMLQVMGEADYVLKFPGTEEFVRCGKAKEFIPNLEVVFVPEGTHFVHEQFPETVNQLIITFIKNHG